MTRQSPRCGTIAGYRKHHRTNTTPCPPCREANNTYQRRYNKKRGLYGTATDLVDATGTVRRIRALMTLGWPEDWVIEMAGVPPQQNLTRRNKRVKRSTAEAIAAAYENLCMTFPPQDTAEQRRAAARARNIAAREGHAPPLAWDDIDTDTKPRGIAA